MKALNLTVRESTTRMAAAGMMGTGLSLLFCILQASATVIAQCPQGGSCISAPPGLVSWWPGDGTGQEFVSDNRAAIVGNVSFPCGMAREAFSFEGGFLKIADSPDLQITGDLTIALWVYHVRSPIPGFAHLVSRRGASCGPVAYQLAVSRDSGALEWLSGGRKVTSTIKVPERQWTFVASVYHRTEPVFGFYVNDQSEVAEGAIAIQQVANADIEVGQGQGCPDTSLFTGLMDEVQMYRRALSDQELQAIFSAGNAGMCKGDCNSNGIADAIDISNGTSQDCNTNGMPDECECEGANCDAGGRYSVECQGALGSVQLNGTGSSSDCSCMLSYSWGNQSCPGAEFDDPSSPTPVLTVEYSGGTVQCRVELRVSNGIGPPDYCWPIIRVVDTTPPEITLNGPEFRQLQCNIDKYTEQGAIASDMCQGEVPVTIAGDIVDASKVGGYRVTYNAEDSSGNKAVEKVRTVEVVDTIAPGFTELPASITVECEDPCGVPKTNPVIAAFLAGAVANDACDLNVAVTNNAPDCFPHGATEVRWTARDKNGNEVSEIRTVTVVDTTPPEITCPPDMVVDCTTPTGTAIEDYGVQVVDRCDSSPTVEFAPPPGTPLGPGVHEVVCTATDASGNVAPCVFTIEVKQLSVEITGRESATRGDTVKLTAEVSGIETAANEWPTYAWRVVSGRCEMDGSNNERSAQARLMNAGEYERHDCVLEVIVGGSACNSSTDNHTLHFEPGEGRRLPADCNQDSILDISDGVCLLGHLFLGNPLQLPCGDRTLAEPGNVRLLDSNGDIKVDLSDAVRVFGFLFLGDEPPVLGTECAFISGCTERCAR